MKREVGTEVMTVKELRLEEEVKKKEEITEKGLKEKKGVKSGDIKDTQEVDQKTITVKTATEVLTCQGWTSGRTSWSWPGLYLHTLCGGVCSIDCVFLC